MKNIKIVIGIAAGMYALFGVVQLINTLRTADSSEAYGFASITASIAVPCLGAAISLACLKSAFAPPKPRLEDQEDAPQSQQQDEDIQ